MRVISHNYTVCQFLIVVSCDYVVACVDVQAATDDQLNSQCAEEEEGYSNSQFAADAVPAAVPVVVAVACE